MSPRPKSINGSNNGLACPEPNNGTKSSGLDSDRSDTIRSIGFLKLRGKQDDLPQRWWFASTAVPLLAATQGPLSNVLSIAALVTPWRVALPNGGELPEGVDDAGIGIEDPRWEITLNGVSLACGFAGNLLLLLHFVGRVRYIVALPLSIIFWLLASGILITITSCLSIYDAAVPPGEIYSQGYWHAVLASITYMLGAVMLIVNMVGYLRGHYPQNFVLDDDQRTLILQTMQFMIWLAGGAAIFSRLEDWSYANAFAINTGFSTILTIGFGEFAPTTNAARGFLFVYEPIGIVFLGLVIGSITRFVSNISADNVIKKHQAQKRASTIGRSVTTENELRERLGLPPQESPVGLCRNSLATYGNIKVVGRTVTFREHRTAVGAEGRGGAAHSVRPLSRDVKPRARSQGQSAYHKRHERRRKLLLLPHEKDRFYAMREIQDETRRFKQYWSLAIAIFAFALIWFLGALIFMLAEARLQGMTYFDSLYFCFVALLTIGYGDISPRSNIGKPFFIVWSLIAVPSLTVLIQEMSSTVAASINRGTLTLADWTILPKKGVVKAFLDSHPRLRGWLTRLAERRKPKKRIEAGFQVQDPDEETVAGTPPNEAQDKHCEGTERIEPLKESHAEPEDYIHNHEGPHDLARQLATTIKRVAKDLRVEPPKRYSFEEWVHFTKLIRFSSPRHKQMTRTVPAVEDIDDGETELVEWDWIGEESPMLADVSESEWVLDRLCESLHRYMRHVGRVSKARQQKGNIRESEEHEQGPSSETDVKRRTRKESEPFPRDGKGTTSGASA
ncbi:uncharacterized protein BCR38DRAFT_410182 [Pseudomassariella vexata]|uniref:Potassium channel domain-containing protein n=1 Tax=Pseudomassariella vexata TaxID=1141098 RepID=A0A1Y2DVS2_9PEZI|nr:uncharacterized protein BCR38DRAFT_410182 [Pseudomassariella vexata]ORY63236.1 hypothetical protein BCR38DRAFT_410182 [Pseudomassariella vexata]